MFDRICAYLERTLEDARAAGLIGPVDVRETTLRLFAYLEGVYVVAKVHNDPQMLVDLGTGAIQLLKQDGDRMTTPCTT